MNSSQGKSKVVKNYIYNTLYQLLVILAPLITTPYISRVLGAEGVGTYSYARSIASYFIMVGTVGTTLYGQREIAYVQDNSEERTKVFWEIIIFRFICVMACAFAYYAVFAMQGQYAEIYKILTIEVIATAFDISWFFIGLENFKTTVIRNTIVKLVGIILTFVLVKKANDVSLYTFCLTIPILIGNLSLWFNLKKYLTKFSFSFFTSLKRHIKPILILFFPQIATEVYLVLDKTMIGVLANNTEVGYYTQAQQIIKVALTIVTSLGAVMLPAMSAAFARGEKKEIEHHIEGAFQFTFMIAAALAFGLCAISDVFVPIFFGAGFDEVVPLMIVISPIVFIIGVSNVIGKQYLLPTKQQIFYTLSVVGGAISNFCLNMFLIPVMNAVGASIATVIAELTVTIIQCWCVRKQLPLLKFIKPLFKYIMMGFVMFGIVKGVGMVLPNNSIGLLIMICVGGIVYLFELLITKDPILEQGKNLVLRKVGKR